MKTICFYNFFPVNRAYEDNLNFFLENTRGDFHALYVSHPSTWQPPRVEGVTWVPVDNLNQDFGSLSELISRFWEVPLYDALFIANSSVRGPLRGVKSESWLSHYKSAIRGGAGAVSDTLNKDRWFMPHSLEYRQKHGWQTSVRTLQTTNLLLSREAVEALLESGLFEQRVQLTKRQIVRDYEIRLSQVLSNSGFELVEVEKEKSWTLGGWITGDPHSSLLPIGNKPSPRSHFFLKTNRGLFSEEQIHSFR